MTLKRFIKKRLTEELMGTTPKKIVAGVLIKCIETDRVFLLFRNDKVPTWALMSGGVDEGEEPLEALKREMFEELFLRPGNVQFKQMRVEQFPERNMEFHYFEGLTNSEFIPILDHENLNYGWFSKDKLPSPLYRGLDQKIAAI
jgi:8-oxo-dGTP pyrophosphatase MutT (NUDIX family)